MKEEGTIMRQPPTNRITYPDRTLNCVYEESPGGATAPIFEEPDMEATAR